MPSNSESLNKRIRQTVSSLPDEDLVDMLNAARHDYTPFALQVAREELSKRRRIANAASTGGGNPAVLKKPSAGEARAGCYIEVWSEKNFEGEYLKIEGPVEWASLHSGSFDWGGSISSLRVGPIAFVLMYADEDFKGTVMSFGPGQEVMNLEELEFSDEIDSIRMVNSVRVFDESRSDELTGECAPDKKY